MMGEQVRQGPAVAHGDALLVRQLGQGFLGIEERVVRALLEGVAGVVLQILYGHLGARG